MADVDPKLQSNRVKDLGGTVRPSRKIELAIIVAVSPDPHDVRPRVLPCGASLPDLRAHVPGLRPMVADRRPVGAGRGRARRTGRGVRRGRVADRQQGRAVGNRRQGTHPRGRVRACHGPWRGRGEGDAPARRGHGVKAHRSGPLAQRACRRDIRWGSTSWTTRRCTPAGRTWLSFWRAHVPANPCATRSRPCSRHRARAWRPRTRATSST